MELACSNIAMQRIVNDNTSYMTRVRSKCGMEGEISERWCNTPGVINTKTVMSSYALQSIWSYWKLCYAFTKTSLHLCYKCCFVLFESSSKSLYWFEIPKTLISAFKFYPENLIQNLSTFWGWASKQKCRACQVRQSLFLEFSKLFYEIWSNLKRRDSLNVPFF